MTTVFAVATVAAGVVVAAGQYRKAAARAERELMDRVTLESAVAAQADALLTGPPAPLATHPGLTFALNGRTVTVEVSAPQGKYDLNGDGAEAIGQGLAVWGMDEGLRKKLAGASATPTTRVDSLRDVAAALRLSQAEEDCARRWITLGRRPGPMDTTGLGTAGKDAATRSIGPSDQADLRAAVTGGGGKAGGGSPRVLWARLRFTGDVDQPWRVHDWRFLRPAAGAAACP